MKLLWKADRSEKSLKMYVRASFLLEVYFSLKRKDLQQWAKKETKIPVHSLHGSKVSLPLHSLTATGWQGRKKKKDWNTETGEKAEGWAFFFHSILKLRLLFNSKRRWAEKERKKKNKVHWKACSKEKVDLPLHSLSEKKEAFEKKFRGRLKDKKGS